jgi:uncharacterized protein with WD repeat
MLDLLQQCIQSLDSSLLVIYLTVHACLVQVWRADNGECVLALHQKTLNRENWPIIKFSSDDSLAAFQVTNTIHWYSTADFAGGEYHILQLGACKEYRSSIFSIDA